MQYATTPAFLAHFGLETRRDLPGIAELKAAGLLEPLPAGEADDAEGADALAPDGADATDALAPDDTND
jgi:segregation and condensation protein B